MPVIPALRGWKQEHQDFQAIRPAQSQFGIHENHDSK